MMRRSSARPLLSAVAIVAAFLCAVTIIGAVSFISNPSLSWSSDGPYTNDSISCNWSYAANAEVGQNITILRNGTQNVSFDESVAVNTSFVIPASWTMKGDNWTCIVTLYNNTDLSQNTTSSASVRIKNSPPITEAVGTYGVFIGGADIGYSYNVVERTVYYVQAIAFDPDNDTLRYQPSSDFCVMTNYSTGNYTCQPRYADIAGNAPTIVPITFTASDGQNVGGRTVQFNVTPVNDPPNFTNIANKTTPLNVSLQMDFAVSDEEGNYPIAYSLSAPYPVNNSLTLQLLNAQGTSVRILYNSSGYSFANVGSWRINLTAIDNSTNYTGGNDSRSTNASFLLNITTIGRPPNYINYAVNLTGWAGGTINLSQGQSVLLNYTANDSDNSTVYFAVADPGNSIYFITNTTKNNTDDGQYARGFTVWTPTNEEVGVYNVSVSAINDPQGHANTTVLRFVINNTNDAPLIYANSYNGSNTLGQTDATALQAYANTPFWYRVNATDPDLQWGDSINFTSNMSALFTINRTTGIVSFTPDDSMIGGPYLVNITVTDNGSGVAAPASASLGLQITVNANTPPGFNATMPIIYCTTKAACGYNFANSTYDTEDVNVTSYNLAITSGVTAINTSLNFTYNATTGLFNFTTRKTDVGNYTLLLTLYDSFGASNSTSINLSINNTIEAPTFIDYDIALYRIVVSHPLNNATPPLSAMDDDLSLPYLGEEITFTTNLSGKTTGVLPTIVPLANLTVNVSRARVLFTPGPGDDGAYSIEINASDTFGNTITEIISFTVYPEAEAPNITMITPWGNASDGYALVELWANTSEAQLQDNIADINVTENTTVRFNITVDDIMPMASYRWTVDDIAQAFPGTNSTNMTYYFDFFSAGNHTVRVNVTNDYYESAVFSWIVIVRDVNRPPVLLRNLTDISVNRSEFISGYFQDHRTDMAEIPPYTRFLDPDDDVDSDNQIDAGSENNTLNFSSNSVCSFADLSVSGVGLDVDINDVGYCIVYFNATDMGGAVLQSNPVIVNVTSIQNGSSPLPETGGGGGSSSIPTVVPITKKYEIPKAFSLLAPKITTIYNNKSVDIPITINNSWIAPLKMVRLSAISNTSGVNATFDTDFFEEIPANQSREVILTVANYRLGQNYEVKVVANTTDPAFEDSALIMLNSIEATSEGDEVNVKVTFANDLVNEHPECLELNEVLDQAKKRIADGNLAEGKQLVESVINGCKYLVGVQQNIREKPSRLNPFISFDEMSVKSIMVGVLVFAVLSTIAFIVYYHYTHKIEDDI